MNLDLSDDEAALLTKELDAIVRNDRYFLSPRIQMLRAILAKLRPEPASPSAAPPQRIYEPPTKGRYRRQDATAETSRKSWQRRGGSCRAMPGWAWTSHMAARASSCARRAPRRAGCI